MLLPSVPSDLHLPSWIINMLYNLQVLVFSRYAADILEGILTS